MERKERLAELYRSCGLDAEDVHTLTLGGKKIPIIKRSGIEKIQNHYGILVTFDLVDNGHESGRVIIKAFGEAKGMLPVETFAEATEKNCSTDYLIMTCEARALGRVVLKLAGFYKEGVFAEGENLETEQ